ncbi:MAG: D-aminoacyl-tRNA deacylase [Anaerovoracaceae bacterium]
MRFLIQVVSKAEVTSEGRTLGAIDNGFLVFIGLGAGDTKEIADKMIDKLLKARILPDENGKTGASLADTGGSLLLVYQFTLMADCRKGNRPSFTGAMAPDQAEEMYDYIVEKCSSRIHTETGSFGADMHVALTNEGPFTIILDSDEICRKK